MSTTEHRIVTPDVVDMVDLYVEGELSDAAKYSNSTPLDESGIWSLHRLAAEIYARGFAAGEQVEAKRNNAVRLRERERQQQNTEGKTA